MIVVSNTTPLIGLASIGRFDLLRQLFGEIQIAQAVYGEAVTAGREDLVLMDEKKGRRKLSQLGLQKIGTLGILLKAKQVGLVTQIRPDIERLRQEGFSISDIVVETVLVDAGEMNT